MQAIKNDIVQQEQKTSQNIVNMQTTNANKPQIQEITSQKQSNNQSNSNKEDDDSKNSMRQKHEQLIKAAEQVLADAGESVDLQFKDLKFSQHSATNRMVVEVVDRDTSEVIREIPSEKVLDMLAKMWDAAGLFVDERK